MTVIEARGVRKVFGATVALDGVNLHVEEGRILGLIGPNGAGKTTALNAILGLTQYQGELRVLGRDPWTERDFSQALKLNSGEAKQALAAMHLQGYIEPIGIERLFNIVERAVSHRFYRRCNRGVRGHHVVTRRTQRKRRPTRHVAVDIEPGHRAASRRY